MVLDKGHVSFAETIALLLGSIRQQYEKIEAGLEAMEAIGKADKRSVYQRALLFVADQSCTHAYQVASNLNKLALALIEEHPEMDELFRRWGIIDSEPA